jgi:hypothetical protein
MEGTLQMRRRLILAGTEAVGEEELEEREGYIIQRVLSEPVAIWLAEQQQL